MCCASLALKRLDVIQRNLVPAHRLALSIKTQKTAESSFGQGKAARHRIADSAIFREFEKVCLQRGRGLHQPLLCGRLLSNNLPFLVGSVSGKLPRSWIRANFTKSPIIVNKN